MTSFLHMATKRNIKEHRENKCTHSIELQLPAKFQSFSHLLGKAALPAASDGAPAAPRLYAPRWRWSAALSAPPPVLGEAPQCHPLDILGVLDPVPAAASIHCAFPEALLDATERATHSSGAPPFAVLLGILATYGRGYAASTKSKSSSALSSQPLKIDRIRSSGMATVMGKQSRTRVLQIHWTISAKAYSSANR
jgi:hypothetical protein